MEISHFFLYAPHCWKNTFISFPLISHIVNFPTTFCIKGNTCSSLILHRWRVKYLLLNTCLGFSALGTVLGDPAVPLTFIDHILHMMTILDRYTEMAVIPWCPHLASLADRHFVTSDVWSTCSPSHPNQMLASPWWSIHGFSELITTIGVSCTWIYSDSNPHPIYDHREHFSKPSPINLNYS